MVTEEQVKEARVETREDAARLVARYRAGRMDDSGILYLASVHGEEFLSFVKEALRTVTLSQVDEWKWKHPKPVRPASNPEVVKEEELLAELEWQPGYANLTSDEKEFARGILQWRWMGKNYVTIRFLCGASEDVERREQFNRAWVVTNFVKAKMRLAGKVLPKPSVTSGTNKKRAATQYVENELTQMFRDVAVMRLWKDEGKCLLCGKPATGDWIHHGVDKSHHHTGSNCPICGRLLGLRGEGYVNVDYLQVTGSFPSLYTYCKEHRPHLIDKREIAAEAQEALFREKLAETEQREREAKEKREAERRDRLKLEREWVQSQASNEPRYDEDEIRER